MPKVGFIGLGTMGGGMAINMRKAGYDMIVHDIRKEAAARHLDMGCEWADSIGEVAREADFIFTSLPRPKEVEQIALEPDGLLEGMSAGKVWCDLFDQLADADPAPRRAVRRARHDAARRAGKRRPERRENPQARRSVGGDKAVFEKFKPALDAIGDQVIYIGPIGAGSVAKLVHNMAGYAVQTALAEVFTMGVKAGVEPLALWAAVRQGSLGRQRSFDRLGKQFLRGEFDPPDFALKLAHKDVMLATELARDVGVPMRIAELTRADMTEALTRGWGARDSRVPCCCRKSAPA